ncbi:hypothetical protein [Klebsiella pneumoniae]
MWRATKAAVRAGYPIKTVNLAELAGDEGRLRQRCKRLQLEMEDWISGSRGPTRAGFDGTFRTLLDQYETHPKSSFQKLKPASRRVYRSYVAMMRNEIGDCRINETDGTEVETWFDFWADHARPRGRNAKIGDNNPPEPIDDGKRFIAKARTAVAVLKAAVRFGVKLRHKGCAEFREVLRACQFQPLASRKVYATAAQVTAARSAAHKLGHPRVALCYALQFEGTVRQWDVRGQWLPMSEPQPSAVLGYGEKWIGPTWANVDQNLILRWTPTKTEDTTAAEIVVDLRACPMVMEELKLIPQDERKGPLILNQKTRLPYRDDTFGDIWREVRTEAGIPSNIWNRDLRASGSTEARAANAKIDDLRKLMGHSEKSETTGKVYDRAKLEAHRRIAKARTVHRRKEQ